MTESAPELSMTWQPQIAPHYRLQWEEAQQAFVLLYPEGMIKLNFSGGEILSRCNGQVCVSDIIDELQQKFPQADGIAQDIVEFFNLAINKRWLIHD